MFSGLRFCFGSFLCRPSSPASVQGRARFPSRLLPLSASLRRLFGCRATNQTRPQNKKKTMKTTKQNYQAGQKNQNGYRNTEGFGGIDLRLRQANRSLSTGEVIGLLCNGFPQFLSVAEVVGKWVWIQFPAKQPRSVTSALAELGFRWNKARQAWQHPCGLFRDVAASFDPRQKYGCRPASNLV